MANSNRRQSGTAAIMALSITAGSLAPLIASTPSFAQTASFSDVPSGYWAGEFITQLSQRNIIAGFTDGTFKPEQPVTRAQFAAMVSKAFPATSKRSSTQFGDVPGNYWAAPVITQAYTSGFLAGYPGNRFEPAQNIPREQVLVSLANGLNYSATGEPTTVLNQYYSDANAISTYARPAVAAATQRQTVVNYPNVKFLNPNRTATRADVAAFIYQALVSSGQVAAVNSPYVVAQGSTTPTPTTTTSIPSGTSIPVRYDQAKKILVTKDETAPLTLTVAQDIITSNRTVLIPSGSQVVGDLKPAEGGSQFVARELTMPNGQRYQINATSEVITKTERVSKGTNAGTVAAGAALGAGAAAAIQAVTGNDIKTLPTLGSAGAGALIGLFLGRQNVDLVAIEPNTDLQLTLGSNLALTPTGSRQ